MTARGFTLIEVMIATASFAVVMAIALSFSVSASKQAEFNMIDACEVSALTEISEILRVELAQTAALYNGEDVNGTSITNEPINMISPGNMITFRVMAGYNPVSMQTVWSEPITYSLQLMHGEIADGLDNNGNGRIDEMCLLRFATAAGQPVERFLRTDLLFDNPGQLEFILNPEGTLLEYRLFDDTGIRQSGTISLVNLDY